MSDLHLSGSMRSVRARFKYQIGELVFSEWCPTLISVEPPVDGESDWPKIDQFSPSTLPGEVMGYQLRRAAIDRFPRGLSKQGAWLCYSPRQERLYLVELGGSFQVYLSRRSAKSRQNLKRSVKYFLDFNPDALEVFTESEDMAEFQREAVTISRQTYQERMLKAGLPATADFLQSMQEKAHSGEARGYLLREHDRVVAFAWCTAKDETMVYQIIGYLPQNSKQSPGTVLLYLIIQDLFALGKYRLLDFGPGRASYKESFATHWVEFADSYLIRHCLGNQVRLWLHWRLERFSTTVGRILDRFGFKKKIRLLMRVGVNKMRN